MRAEAHAPRGLFGRQAGPEREPATDTLGGRHDIRLYPVVLVSVQLAGARHAALNLVEDQHQIILIGERAQAAHEFIAGRADTAFALDRFDEEAGRLVAHQRLGMFEIVELGILEACEQGHETLVHLFLIGRADGRHGAAMESIRESDQFGTIAIAIFMLVVGTCRLDRGLDRFGAGIGEKDRVGKGLVDQTLRQRLALRAAVKVGDVHQRLCLLLDCADQAGMAVAEQIDRNAAGEIEVTRAVFVDQMAMLTLDRANAAAGIDGHQR